VTVYRPLRDIDVLQTVLTASPRVSAVSGTTGWRGGPNGSGSISVYGGVRAPGSPLQIQPKVYPSQNDVGVYQPISGSYPLTASIRFVDVLLTRTTEDKCNWGARSWKPIANMYEYYARYNTAYTTSSYDFRTLFFTKSSQNIVINSDASALLWQGLTASMTSEAWIKPLSTSSVGYGGYTIAARQNFYRFFITGSTGLIAFSGSFGLATATVPVDQYQWNHVAVSITANTGTFYVNLKNAGTFTFNGVLAAPPFNPNLCIGGLATASVVVPTAPTGSTSFSFHGFIHEVREWKTGHSWTQLSASHNRRISRQDDLTSYFTAIGGPEITGSTGLGSGSYNGALNIQYPFSLGNWYGPSWHPCDNSYFYVDKTYITPDPSYEKIRTRVVNIPRLMYGRQIATGTLELTCRSFSSPNYELIRIIKDDGRGTLYMASMASSSIDDSSVRNVPWNKVGNVFYSEGIVVITDDSLLDFGTFDNISAQPNDLLSVSFRGISRIPTKMVSCRIGPADANGSNNQTFATQVSGTDRYELVDGRTTYVTAVGLYDSERRLVGVAKLADPLRNRERDRLNIRLKFDL